MCEKMQKRPGDILRSCRWATCSGWQMEDGVTLLSEAYRKLPTKNTGFGAQQYHSRKDGKW